MQQEIEIEGVPKALLDSILEEYKATNKKNEFYQNLLYEAIEIERQDAKPKGWKLKEQKDLCDQFQELSHKRFCSLPKRFQEFKSTHLENSQIIDIPVSSIPRTRIHQIRPPCSSSLIRNRAL